MKPLEHLGVLGLGAFFHKLHWNENDIKSSQTTNGDYLPFWNPWSVFLKICGTQLLKRCLSPTHQIWVDVGEYHRCIDGSCAIIV